MTERYSRLMQFEFADFSKLKDMRAMVVGIGGLGALTAEIMARVGTGELVLMDYDKLEEANLNRLIYSVDQVGMAKVDALSDYLLKANPEVKITTHPYDITDGKGYDAFLSETEKCDIVFGCVDTFQVRLFINSQIVKARKPLIDGGASNDGINGSVHVVIPGETACYRCNRPMVKEESEYKPKSDGSGLCHFTSLPTTMAIISSLQCQEGLKYLLGFGEVASYLMYYGMEGKLERYDWKRDPNCPVCGKV
jgi:ubiquitin-like modifier-activating enzyme 5